MIDRATFRFGIIEGSVNEMVVSWFASSSEDERRVRGSVLVSVSKDGFEIKTREPEVCRHRWLLYG